MYMKVSLSPEELAYEKWKDRYFLEKGAASSRGMLARVKEGWFPGPAPIGYRNGNRDEDPIVLDEVTAPFIREAFELAAQGIPIPAVRRHLEQKGMRGKHGNI